MQEDRAWAVDLDSDGNIYWAPNLSTDAITVKDVSVHRFEPSGDTAWLAHGTYGGQYAQQAYIATFKDTILYIAGRDFHNYTPPPFISGSDAFVAAIDTSDGSVIWNYIWDGGYSYEEVDGLTVMDDGIYITGWTEDSVTSMDIFVMKLSLDGDSIWHSKWGSPLYDQADGHCIVDDSTIYVSGLYNSTNAIFNGDALLAAFDRADGSYKWHQLWVGSNQEDGLGLNTDGTYLYQCGITNSHADSNVFVNKYDKHGNLIWTHLSNMATKGRSVNIAQDGTLYWATTTPSLGAGMEDILIMQLDTATGDLLSYRTWGGPENEGVQDFRLDDSHLYITGSTVSYSASGTMDALLIKAPLFGTVGIGGYETIGSFNVYPNPATSVAHIPFPIRNAELIGIDGRVVRYFTDSTLDLAGINAGTYILVAHTDGSSQVSKLVIR